MFNMYNYNNIALWSGMTDAVLQVLYVNLVSKSMKIEAMVSKCMRLGHSSNQF